jgi:SAM-dependent methyltransferase
MLNVNYEYFANYIEQRNLPDDARVLDYGCGSGEILAALRNRGVDAYGVEIYHKGISEEMQANPLLREGYISVIRFDQPLPYADDHFDVIISNQVLEHVEDIEFTAKELSRILKPGGTMYHHFPSREAWREPHTGIPLSHKFPPGGKFRYTYTYALRTLGLG